MAELKKEKEGGFFDPSQPLTSIIFKSLNYEFMCCILSGLKEISDKEEKDLRKTQYPDADVINMKTSINSTDKNIRDTTSSVKPINLGSITPSYTNLHSKLKLKKQKTIRLKSLGETIE